MAPGLSGLGFVELLDRRPRYALRTSPAPDPKGLGQNRFLLPWTCS